MCNSISFHGHQGSIDAVQLVAVRYLMQLTIVYWLLMLDEVS